eukprot:SAG31_NODE_4535_length_3158_cov_1.518143_1_plen_177_part_10
MRLHRVASVPRTTVADHTISSLLTTPSRPCRNNHQERDLVNASALRSTGFSCIAAVDMAVNDATEVRVSSECDDGGCSAAHFVQWSLPSGRSIDSFWNRELGLDLVQQASTSTVTVLSSTGDSGVCYQNVAGICKLDGHGLGYPSTTMNAEGNTAPDDFCMTIGMPTDNINSNNGNG